MLCLQRVGGVVREAEDYKCVWNGRRLEAGRYGAFRGPCCLVPWCQLRRHKMRICSCGARALGEPSEPPGSAGIGIAGDEDLMIAPPVWRATPRRVVELAGQLREVFFQIVAPGPAASERHFLF